jgi:hypothetical protein
MQQLAEAFVPVGNDTELEAAGLQEFESRENVIENAPGVGLREAIV